MEVVTTVCVGIVVVVAVSLIIYGIVKTKNKYSHTTERGTARKSRCSHNEFENLSDMLQNVKKSQNENFQLRNIGTSEKDILGSVKSVFNEEVQSNLSSYKCHQEVQTDVLENDLSNRKDTQIINEASCLRNSCHVGTQMADSLANYVFTPNINPLESCSDERNVLSNESVSVYSFASNETLSTDKNYPTWHEMSNEEKGLCKCLSCGKIVTTVTYPCKHPYCCYTCAPIFFKFYHRCPTCKQRIKSYDNVF